MEKKQLAGIKTGIFKEKDGSSFSRVYIELNGRCKYHIFQLQEPCRVVVDVENATLAIRKPDFSVEDGVVDRVRLFQFTPDTVRVVLDLPRPYSFVHATEGTRRKNITSFKIVVAIKRDDPEKVGLGPCACLEGKVIVIDPGHGGRDAGISAGGLREKDVSLDVAENLKMLLSAAGSRVLLTREGDYPVPLEERINKANQERADVFLSLHCAGSKDPTARGVEVFHFRSREISKVLASLLLEEVHKALGWPALGVKVGAFLVLREARSSAALVEMGMLTNATEAAQLRLPDTRKKIAEGLAHGIIRYFTELV